MDDKDLDRLLNDIKAPEPSRQAREGAMRAAMDEFEKVKKQGSEINTKGFAGLLRLMGEAAKKLLSSGGNVMTRPAFVNSAIGLFVVVVLAAVATPMFMGQRNRAVQEYVTPAPSVGGTSGRAGSPVERISEPVDSGKDGQAASNVQVAPISPEPLKPAAHEAQEGVVYELAEAPAVEMEDAPAARTEQRKVMSKRAQTMMARESADIMDFAPSPGIVAPGDMPSRQLSQEYAGRDSFEKFEPNPVKLTREEPVSTFSVDVDTASYAFVRRALNNGYIPPRDSIRVEEMINYFDYDYEVPGSKKEPFKPTVAVYPSPWNKGRKLLHIGIKGHDITRYAKPRSNLVFLIDVSGSMSERDKLPLLKNSFRMLVDNLDADDSVAMVVYAGAAGTVLEPTKVEKKGKILAALDKLSAGGSTAGGEGIRLAYALAEQNFESGAVNRVILATDGDFNVGIREPGALQSFVEKERNKGIYLSVLGFGQGNYNDALMQKLAQNGNGNAAYIDSLSEARKVLVDEAGSTLFTIAKDVKIQVEFNPGRVAEYRLIGYETRMLRREDFNNDKVDAGEVGSGHAVTAIYEITPVGSDAKLVDGFRYSKDKPVKKEDKQGEYAFLRIRYKLPREDKSRLITLPIGSDKEYKNVSGAPGEMRFAAGVAAFGQILRGGEHTGEFGYDDVIKLAKPAVGDDGFGYRAEFIKLVRLAMSARSMGQR